MKLLIDENMEHAHCPKRDCQWNRAQNAFMKKSPRRSRRLMRLSCLGLPHWVWSSSPRGKSPQLARPSFSWRCCVCAAVLIGVKHVLASMRHPLLTFGICLLGGILCGGLFLALAWAYFVTHPVKGQGDGAWAGGVLNLLGVMASPIAGFVVEFPVTIAICRLVPINRHRTEAVRKTAGPGIEGSSAVASFAHVAIHHTRTMAPTKRRHRSGQSRHSGHSLKLDTLHKLRHESFINAASEDTKGHVQIALPPLLECPADQP